MVTNTHQIESESCVQSYSPRAVRFDTLLPSTELGSQRNIGEETRTKITQKDFRDGGLIASILRICYGTFEQRKAAIVVIQILLSRNLHQRRHLEVEVSFQPRHIRSRKDKDNVQFPIVRNLAPRKVYGIPNTDGLTWSYKIEQLCFNPSVASGISSAMSNEARNTFEVSPSLSIIGKPWSDSRRREVHKACWIIKDKGQPSVGIPDEVYLGAIVQYEDTFQADVRVTLDAPSYLKFFAFPWPQDDPILFPNRDPGPFIGGDIGITQFETLSDTEWSTLLSGYVNPNVGAKKETVKEASTVATRGLKTFRVQGIPPECGPEAIPALLFGLFGLSHDQKPDIETFSLCADVERVNEHVATISSAQLQAALGTGDQWKAPLASDNGGATLAGRRHIVMDTHFYGITPLSAPKDRDEHLYDIVALSGLGGHAFGSFKERKGDYMWLRDSLPNDFPHARVLTYGYDTKLEDSRSIQDLDAIAGTFRTALKATRPRYSDGRLNDRPIIFISHSLGGILLKQALIQMTDGDEKDKANCLATRGILFFGVPSQGMDISSLVAIVNGKVNENFLKGLRPDSEILRDQHWDFCKAFPYRSCKIISFYETEYSPTAKRGPNGWKMNGEDGLLVGPSSATLGSRAWEVGPNYSYAIKRNHSDMVKFSLRDHWYSIVRQILNDLVEGIESIEYIDA